MTGRFLRNRHIKRLLDATFALAGVILTVPAWILIPLFIKLEDGGPIFFRQQRLGKDFQTFESLKFRSMIEDHGKPPSQGHPSEELITQVGRFIRPTALDELPQLWNILRGDMSLVGPRADVPEEVDSAEGKVRKLSELPGYRERLSVRPGLTGLAQLRLPRDAPYRKKLRLDLFYVRNWNVLLDLTLILKSVFVSLTGRWPKIGT